MYSNPSDNNDNESLIQQTTTKIYLEAFDTDSNGTQCLELSKKHVLLAGSEDAKLEMSDDGEVTLYGLVTPTQDAHAANKKYVDDSISGISFPVTSVNSQTGAVSITRSSLGAGTYSKPSGGIPKTDLASAVQTSLGKADTALQSAPVSSVDGKTGTVTVLPSGGSSGQVLQKSSSTDYAVEWATVQSAPEVYVGNTTPSGYTLYIDPDGMIPSAQGVSF